MPIAHRKPGFREQRRVTREILSQQPTGMLRLHVEGACLDVIPAKDISPFGVGIQINAAIDDDAPVRVDEDIAALAPHSPGRAQFAHPVLRSTDSLTIRSSDNAATPSVTHLVSSS